MTTLTQGINVGEWLLSEAAGQRSRSKGTGTVAGNVALPSGTVMGRLTASPFKWVKYDNALSNGAETAKGVLLNPLPGVNGDYAVTIIDTDAEIIGAMLNGGAGTDAAGIADLLALGIKVR